MLETNIDSKSCKIHIIHQFRKKKKDKVYVYNTSFNRSYTCKSTMTIEFEDYTKYKDKKIKGHIQTRNIWVELMALINMPE